MATDLIPDKPHPQSLLYHLRTSEDWWAIWCGFLLVLSSFALVWMNQPADLKQKIAAGESVSISNPLKPWLGKPGSWEQDPRESFIKPASGDKKAVNTLPGTAGAGVLIGLLFAGALYIRGKSPSRFLAAFPFVFLLAVLAYVLAGQSVVKAYNLEYALWALLVGLLISNTVGTPSFLKPAVLTEFYIKTGLVMLGAEVLMSRLMALGIPGVAVAWVVTPIVLITTYIFGQKVLKIESRSLNMVICADMSVCGVSAAIATAAACKAKKEELSLAIGLSLSFTVVMMVLMPAFITWVGMDEIIGGAWMGGTIDATGAVAAAGATLGDRALEVAATVKMIQNILIGVTAFGVAVYWTTVVEREQSDVKPSLMEIWTRFPKFVIGFVLLSVVFSIIHASVPGGPELTEATFSGSTKTLRGWFFCLAFVSIGLDTNFFQLLPFFKGGKPLILYCCGQSLNLCLTLLMAWLAFSSQAVAQSIVAVVCVVAVIAVLIFLFKFREPNPPSDPHAAET